MVCARRSSARRVTAEICADLLAGALEAAAAAGDVSDALIASSLAQAAAIWKLRESVPEAQRRHGASLKHDLSVPISAVPRLIERGTALMRRLAPDGEVIAYGHVGDGNLHFNLSQTSGTDRATFLARQPALEEAMFDLTESLGGSFSAEHGIGRLRAAQLAPALRSGRVRNHARNEASARPAGNLESRQGLRVTSARRLVHAYIAIADPHRAFAAARIHRVATSTASTLIRRIRGSCDTCSSAPATNRRHTRIPRRPDRVATGRSADAIRARGRATRESDA